MSKSQVRAAKVTRQATKVGDPRTLSPRVMQSRLEFLRELESIVAEVSNAVTRGDDNVDVAICVQAAEASGMSSREIARLLDCSPMTAIKWGNGEQIPHPLMRGPVVGLIAKELRLRSAELDSALAQFQEATRPSGKQRRERSLHNG